MAIFRRIFGRWAAKKPEAPKPVQEAQKAKEQPKPFSWEAALKEQNIPANEIGRIKIILEGRKNLGMWKPGELTEEEFVGVYARYLTKCAEFKKRKLTGEGEPKLDVFITAYIEAKRKKK